MPHGQRRGSAPQQRSRSRPHRNARRPQPCAAEPCAAENGDTKDSDAEDGDAEDGDTKDSGSENCRRGTDPLPALRSHGQQWHQLHRDVCGGFGLLIGPGLRALVLLLVLTPPVIRAEGRPGMGLHDFGRWERSTLRCLIRSLEEPNSGEQESSCHSLRLDQQMAGLLSIRLLPELRSGRAAGSQLVFAGVLAQGSQPLQCREGRCELQGEMVLRVSAVASGAMGGAGQPLRLPQTHLAQGSCRLELQQGYCQARDREGRRWSAQLRW